MHLVRTILAHATNRPDRVALAFEHDNISYGVLSERIGQYANILKEALSIKKGDRVAYIDYNRPQALYLLFACARIGAIFLPINWRLSEKEILAVIKDASPSVIYVGDQFVAPVENIKSEIESTTLIGSFPPNEGWVSIESLIEKSRPAGFHEVIGENDPVLMVYTSGTTGKPKGSLLSHGALFWTSINSVQAHDFNSLDHVLTDLPLFHVGGLLLQTVPMLFAGGRVTLQSRFDPSETLHNIGSLRPSTYLAVPATMNGLIDDPSWRDTDLSSLRQVMAGSAIVPVDLISQFHERGVPVGQLYGATEMGIGTCLRAHDAFRRVGSCGKPVTFCDLRVVADDGSVVEDCSVGEICIAGPSLMDGYWKNSEATAEVLSDGWYRTGDVGLRDADGFLYLKARKREVINAGGEKIYPAEIEAALTDCNDVLEVAVVGYPDRKWGELPAAFIVPRDGSTIEPSQITEFLNGRLARYKYPRQFIFVDELPRNAMGKVSKADLQMQVTEALNEGG